MTRVEGSQILVTLGQVLASGYAPAPPARVTTLASTGQDGVEDGARWPGKRARQAGKGVGLGLDRPGGQGGASACPEYLGLARLFSFTSIARSFREERHTS